MNHISHLSSAEARRLWECLMDPPAVHILWENLTALLCDLFSVERTNLFLVIPEKQQLRTRAATQFKWDVVLPWHEGIAGHVYQSRRPLVVNNIPASDYGHHFNRQSSRFATRAMLTVPVFRDGDENQQIVALIQLVNKIGGEFDACDTEALKYWARQIGVTLERSHGTEIWRHPESEPPSLEDPEFGTVLPKLSADQVARTLACCVAAAISQWRECHPQSQNLARMPNRWESHELLKMMRDECRHAHLMGRLAQEAPSPKEGIGWRCRFILKLLRLLSLVSRSPDLRYLIGSYHEWFGFYGTSFLYRLYEGMARERNLLHAVVEDERSHCTFYESRLLEQMIHHPQKRYRLNLMHNITRRFYVRLTKRLIQPLVGMTRRPELPEKFCELFLKFSDHRTQALFDRAMVRATLPHGWRPWVARHLYGWGGVIAYAGIALFLVPFACIWPTQSLTQEYAEGAERPALA